MKWLLNIVLIIAFLFGIILSGYVYLRKEGKIDDVLEKKIIKKIEVTPNKNYEKTLSQKANLSKILSSANIEKIYKTNFYQIDSFDKKKYFFPVTNGKYLILPKKLNVKYIKTISEKSVSLKYQQLKDIIYYDFKIVELDSDTFLLKKTIKPELYISKKLFLFGFDSSGLIYTETAISKKISNDYKYKYMNNYKLIQNFDTDYSYIAYDSLGNNCGIVVNGILFTSNYFDKLIKFNKILKSGLFPLIKNTRLNDRNFTYKTIPNIINDFVISSFSEFQNLLLNAYIFDDKIMIFKGLYKPESIIELYPDLKKYSGIDVSFNLGSMFVNSLSLNSKLNKYGISAGDRIIKLNDQDFKEYYAFFRFMYENNFNINSIEVLTKKNVKISLSGL